MWFVGFISAVKREIFFLNLYNYAYLKARLDTERWQYIDEETDEDTHDSSTVDAVTDG
jgi:hypothetical protein